VTPGLAAGFAMRFGERIGRTSVDTGPISGPALWQALL
jgi:hypothetical protein